MNKSLRFSLIVALSLLGSSLFAEDNAIRVVSLWNNTNMLVNSTSTSMALDLWQYKPERYNFSVQLLSTNAVTNSGAMTLSIESSNNGTDFPLSSNIITGFSFTNSPAADGKGLYPISPTVSRYIRLKAIVTLTNAQVSAWLFIQ